MKVRDGRVPAGTNWSPEIRRRIRKSKLIVGDITGLSSEVLFELGFGLQLKKTIIPVTETEARRQSLPPWLTFIQMESYRDGKGLAGVLSSIEVQLFSPALGRLISIPQPISTLVVWMRRTEWNAHALEQTKRVCERRDLSLQVLSDSSPSPVDAIRRAASAWLVVASLDGTDNDNLAHFVCGAIVAKPQVSAASNLPRAIVIVEEPGHKAGSLTAESLKNCGEMVTIVPIANVSETVSKFVAERERATERLRKRRG